MFPYVSDSAFISVIVLMFQGGGTKYISIILKLNKIICIPRGYCAQDSAVIELIHVNQNENACLK